MTADLNLGDTQLIIDKCKAFGCDLNQAAQQFDQPTAAAFCRIGEHRSRSKMAERPGPRLHLERTFLALPDTPKSPCADYGAAFSYPPICNYQDNNPSHCLCGQEYTLAGPRPCPKKMQNNRPIARKQICLDYDNSRNLRFLGGIESALPSIGGMFAFFLISWRGRAMRAVSSCTHSLWMCLCEGLRLLHPFPPHTHRRSASEAAKALNSAALSNAQTAFQSNQSCWYYSGSSAGNAT